jgi:hypothetical protein
MKSVSPARAEEQNSPVRVLVRTLTENYPDSTLRGFGKGELEN